MFPQVGKSGQSAAGIVLRRFSLSESWGILRPNK
jgi:hypothetical protein